MSAKKKLPRYTEQGRYPYHFACTKILPDSKRNPAEETKWPRWMRERTHGCWCSSWRQKSDGTFLKWSDKDNDWFEPKRGEIKSKPISDDPRK